MSETPSGSPAARWWIIVAIVAIVLLAIVYFATRKSQHADANAAGNGTSQGQAYDETTGNVVPANAAPGALSVGAPNSLGEDNGNTGGAAGGTDAAAYGPGGAQGSGTMMPGAGGSGAGNGASGAGAARHAASGNTAG